MRICNRLAGIGRSGGIEGRSQPAWSASNSPSRLASGSCATGLIARGGCPAGTRSSSSTGSNDDPVASFVPRIASPAIPGSGVVEGALAGPPLSAVADLAPVPGEGVVTRRDGARADSVQGFLTRGILPEGALAICARRWRRRASRSGRATGSRSGAIPTPAPPRSPTCWRRSG
jgi:hypothetical protein